MLNMHQHTLLAKQRKGLITPLFVRRNGRSQKYYKVEEIATLQEFAEKNLSLKEIANLAQQAYAKATAAEKRAADLYDLLGFNNPALGKDEDEIVELFIKAEDALASMTNVISATEVRAWAEAFYAMDEAYLGLVEHYTACTEPWHVYICLGQELRKKMTLDVVMGNPRLRQAQGYLNMAFEHLRNVSYHYCYIRHGREKARGVFAPTNKDTLEEVIHLMFLPDSQP